MERLRASLHFTGAAADGVGPSASGRRHTVFVDSGEEAAAFSAAEFFDTPAELLGRAFNRPRAAQLASADALRGVAGPAGVAKRAERCAA